MADECDDESTASLDDGRGHMKSRIQRRRATDHGKWSQQGVPHKGWQYRGFTDLEDLVGSCEMCETRSIRYVHYMEHPDYDAMLGVGRVCAGKMEEDYTAAQQREKRAQSIARRRTTWMKAKWRTSSKGNSFINRNGLNIVVYPSFRRWGYQIREREGERSRRQSGFASEDDAKLAAFECYVELQE